MTSTNRECPFCEEVTPQYPVPPGRPIPCAGPFGLDRTHSGVFVWQVYVCLSCLKPNSNVHHSCPPEVNLRKLCARKRGKST